MRAEKNYMQGEVIPWLCATCLSLEGREKEKYITVRSLPNVHLFIFLRVPPVAPQFPITPIVELCDT